MGEDRREHAGSGEEHARVEGQDCLLGQGCGTERKLPSADGVRCTMTVPNSSVLPCPLCVFYDSSLCCLPAPAHTHTHTHKFPLTRLVPSHYHPSHISPPQHITYTHSHSLAGVLVLRLAGHWPTWCSLRRYGKHWGLTAATSQ